jgi:hypothetical protein
VVGRHRGGDRPAPPGVVDVSAWWGQYGHLLLPLAAVVFALNGRNGLAAAALAVCVMTKPQALPFVLPFAAWFWAHGGLREIARTAVIGLVVAVVLWLPFIPAGGPFDYLRNLAEYQNEIFPYLSLNAWNIWWLVQIAAVGGFASDQIAVIGPITLRHVGFVLTGLLSVVVAVLIVRDQSPRTILGLVACPHLVRLPDPDARAIRVRGAGLPAAPHPGATDPVALGGLRSGLHPQPVVRRPPGADLPCVAPISRSAQHGRRPGDDRDHRPDPRLDDPAAEPGAP